MIDKLSSLWTGPWQDGRGKERGGPVCTPQILFFRPFFDISVRKDRGLNILQYEKQTRLINSLLDGQEMRNGKSSLKSSCDLGLKLESCWVTDRHRPDDFNRFLHL